MPPVAAKYFDEVVRIADSHAARCAALYHPETGCKVYLWKPGDAGPAPDVPIDSPLLSHAPELIALQAKCSWAPPPPATPAPQQQPEKLDGPPTGSFCMFAPIGQLPVPYTPDCDAGKFYSDELEGSLLSPSESVLVPLDERCTTPWVEIRVNRSLGRPGAMIRVHAVFQP